MRAGGAKASGTIADPEFHRPLDAVPVLAAVGMHLYTDLNIGVERLFIDTLCP
jgi:hypothetical protein